MRPDMFGTAYSEYQAKQMAMSPNPAVNTDARRRGFARTGVAGYLTR